jgi:polyphosphate kinase
VNKNKYFDRELSWLSFNYRVLQEAKDKTVPPLERLKFLAIYSSNLDEFFRVRVASLRSLLSLKTKAQKKLQFDPYNLLETIKETVSKQQEEFGNIYRNQVLPELEKNNIFLVDENNFSREHNEFLKSFFFDEVVPFIQPVLLDKKKISTFLHNKSIYLAVRLTTKSKSKGKTTGKVRSKYALIEIPSKTLGRFITLPQIGNKNFVIFLDDIIRIFLSEVFPDYNVESFYSVKLTRDAELYIDDEFSGNLLQKIQKGLSKRTTGVPSRFLYDKQMPKPFLRFLREALDLKNDDLIEGGKYHNFNDFFSFPNFNLNKLEYEPMPPITCKDLSPGSSIFDAISKKDILLSFPYQSYGYVLQFLEESANDVNVKSIRISLYRVASESLVVRSLIKAAQNGKKVSAFVEIKARFDEVSNFSSAEALQNAGVNVLYSFPGLKVHAKLCIVERIENEKNQFYSYFGTGNFNEKTARIYCDYALLTKNQEMAKDAVRVFDFLIHKNDKQSFKHLLVAPFNMRQSFVKLIDNEIKDAEKGNNASISIKLNSLEDRKMIKKLYEASQAGVKIRIIVRGICCLVPGIEGMSENILVISIVDRFLEHARIYVFHNTGEELVYVASADWMKRNLSRRIEVAFPVYNKKIKSQLLKQLEIQWNDNTKARELDELQSNKYRSLPKRKKVRSQYEIYDYIRSLN